MSFSKIFKKNKNPILKKIINCTLVLILIIGIFIPVERSGGSDDNFILTIIYEGSGVVEKILIK